MNNILNLPNVNANEKKMSIEVHLCPIQTKKPDYSFLPTDYTEVTQAIIKKIPLQKLLKLIHFKFNDEGLTFTLIHRIYESTQYEIQYYVPELVYIAVRKMCKPMRKVLVFKGSSSQNLRRLILWNIKAFTVLMIQKDPKLKQFIEAFQQQIVRTVLDHAKFTNSEKAIAMLATTSLVLKKLPREQIKDKLKKFIKRYNYEILNNTQHTIMIPFRRNELQKNINSSYITKIVQDNCSCFPTRKRVPYRIILETIDITELKNHHELQNIHRTMKPTPDKERDLFDEVKQEVEKNFKAKHDLRATDNKYPFVIDQDYFVNMSQLNKYAKKIESEEKDKNKDKGKDIPQSNKPIIRRDTIATFKSKMRSSKMEQHLLFNKGKFEIKDNEQLRKYETIYIPTLPSNLRRSDNYYPKGIWVTTERQNFHQRFSDRKSNSESKGREIKVVQQQVKYEGNATQSVFKQPWVQTVKMLKQLSPFRKLQSLKYRNMVVKGGDDLRQQIICMQLIYKMQSIIRDAAVDVFIKPYEIIVLSENSGMLEFVSNSISVDAMKKQKDLAIHQFYVDTFNTQAKFLQAKGKFICSLAGSSILTYILKLKDRHNGNILLDIEGHIIHIDFGFILGMSPGGINFQSSPFKLTQQYVLLMGGKDSPDYLKFVSLFYEGMSAIRKRCDELCLILQIMMQESDLQCFQNFRIEVFRDRFQQQLSQDKFKQYCQGLVEKSCMNSRTVHYDTFQKITNGIMP